MPTAAPSTAADPSSARRVALNWILGAFVGTLLIGLTSPLFVRSYLPLEPDQPRGTWTLPAQQTYRWRAEGYANTVIGAHGMPGRADLPGATNVLTQVALWGDSQTEGVAVVDRDKLFAQAEQLSIGKYTPMSVLPLTRSGEDAADWLTQMPRIESDWGIDAHVILIADLEDLQHATEAPLASPSDADVAQANAAIARRLPAFVIQAARYLLTESDDVTRRKLRFSLGRVKPKSKPAPPAESPVIDWQPQVDAIARTTKLPVVIVYAPQVPSIVGGKVVKDDWQSDEFAQFREAATNRGISVIDVRDELRTSVEAGRWPHGFHNGQFGVGHLNAIGYGIVAESLVDGVNTAVSTK